MRSGKMGEALKNNKSLVSLESLDLSYVSHVVACDTKMEWNYPVCV